MAISRSFFKGRQWSLYVALVSLMERAMCRTDRRRDGAPAVPSAPSGRPARMGKAAAARLSALRRGIRFDVAIFLRASGFREVQGLQAAGNSGFRLWRNIAFSGEDENNEAARNFFSPSELP
jgi:hypothetical protein